MEKRDDPCMAITLVNPRKPQEAGSYLWCVLQGEGKAGHMHLSYCGMYWDTTDLVEPTENMRAWRTGNWMTVKRVSGRMLG